MTKQVSVKKKEAQPATLLSLLETVYLWTAGFLGGLAIIFFFFARMWTEISVVYPLAGLGLIILPKLGVELRSHPKYSAFAPLFSLAGLLLLGYALVVFKLAVLF